jgi:hypothetical protein
MFRPEVCVGADGRLGGFEFSNSRRFAEADGRTLSCLQTACARCARPLRCAYDNWRSVTLLNVRVVRLRSKIRR